ncbi:hypothetical protein FS749_011600 [Ceratobasidium sp. UAMH 11750]|nr:hypothetical protein FS749_011600 [Ceratobasidium sp. UAMH 11750]
MSGEGVEGLPSTVYFSSSNDLVAVELGGDPKMKFTVTHLECIVPHETSTATDFRERDPGETSTGGDDKKGSARTIMFHPSRIAPGKVERFLMASDSGKTHIYIGHNSSEHSNTLVLRMEDFATGRPQTRGQGTWNPLGA